MPFKSAANSSSRLRWLLVALALTLAACATIVVWQSRASLGRPKWHDMDFQALEEVQLLQEYISIDTTSGNEIAGAEWLASLLRKHGLEPQVERLASGQANVWAIIEGKRPEALVLHHHIDVFPADPEEWDTPPFEGRIMGPLLVGRGSFDMKSYGVAQLLAFLDVASAARQPEYSLILLATADEETDSRLGADWFAREHPDLIGRFWAVLTEGGANESFEEGIVRYWGVEVGQMRLVRIIACAPTRRRLEELAADLDRIPAGAITVLPAVSQTIQSLAPHRRSPGHVLAMSDPDALDRDRWRVDRLPEFLRLLVFEHIQLLGFADSDPGYKMGLLAWLRPGRSDAEAVAAVERLLPPNLTSGVEFSVEVFPGPDPSPTDHPVYQALTTRLARRGGDAGPYFLPRTLTDSRQFRGAGVPSYGYSPFAFVAAGLGGKDRVNERILLTSYVEGVADYRATVHEIVGLEAASNSPQ